MTGLLLRWESMDIYEVVDKQLERNLYVLETLGEITGDEYCELVLSTLRQLPYSPEPPSQQAKQTGVGELHDDGRVGASTR